jgi:hypothetical protein
MKSKWQVKESENQACPKLREAKRKIQPAMRVSPALERSLQAAGTSGSLKAALLPPRLFIHHLQIRTLLKTTRFA